MLLFSSRKNKEHAVQSFIVSLLNNSCPDLRSLEDGPRVDSRVNLCVVVLAIPVVNKKPVVERMFPAVTKEISSLGVSLVLNEPRAVDEVILAFRWEGEMKFVRAQAKHLSPMGAGFYQLGLQLTEMVHVSDHPALKSVLF